MIGAAAFLASTSGHHPRRGTPRKGRREMRHMWITAGLVAGMVAVGAPGAAAAPLDQPEREVLRFLDISQAGRRRRRGDALPG